MAKILQERLESVGVDRAVAFTDQIRDVNLGNKTQKEINGIIDRGLSEIYDKPAYNITSDQISKWENKSDFSGSYNDLTNKPTIPDELADLASDASHRTVTDTEKSTWNSKVDASSVYTKSQVDDKIAAISSMSFEIVGSLPDTGDTSKIYLLKRAEEINIFKYFPTINYDPSLFINTLDKISDVAFDGNKEYVFKIDVRNGFEYNISTRSFVAINQNNERFVTTLTGFWESVGTTDISYDSENLTSPEENIIYYSDYQTLGYIYLWWKASANFKTMYHIYRNYEDIYDEYIWISSTSTYEKIGSTSVDLSEYAKTSDVPTKTSDITNDSDFVSDSSYNHTDNNFTDDYKSALDILAYDYTTTISPTSNTVYNSASAATITATMTKKSKVSGSNVSIASPTVNSQTMTGSNNTYTKSFSSVSATTTYTFKDGSRTIASKTYTRSIVGHILYGTTTSTSASSSLLTGATVYSGSATTSSTGRYYSATGLASTFYFFIAIPRSNSGYTDVSVPSKVNIGTTYDALAASDFTNMGTATYSDNGKTLTYTVYRSPALAADTTSKNYYVS